MKYLKQIGVLFIASIVLSATVLLYCYFNNFYTVIPDKIYRARQLNQAQFEKFIKQYHIKSVLNLRGEHLDDNWYFNEIQATKNTQIIHYDLGLLSTVLPASDDIQKLITILNTAPKPLLIHCESGVDRTGFASAIALILANDRSLAHIREQTSIRYFVIWQNSIGKQFLRLYVDWLSKNHLQTSRDNLLKFLREGNYPHD